MSYTDSFYTEQLVNSKNETAWNQRALNMRPTRAIDDLRTLRVSVRPSASATTR